MGGGVGGGVVEISMVSIKLSLRGRHGLGNKGNFESGQNKSKACSFILEDRELSPLFVTIDTSCKLYFKRDNILQLRTSNSLVDC